MRKVLLITEYLNPPYDEGIKKTVSNLYKKLDKKYHVSVICRYGYNKNNIHVINPNPLFIDFRVRRVFIDFNPKIIIYFPFASTTFASYLRLFIFKIFGRSSKIILFSLQPKELNIYQKKIVKYIKPAIALTPSPELKEKWDDLGINTKLIPLFTDLEDFRALQDDQKKIQLRDKYDIPKDKYIISHMGHLNFGRNLESLIPLQEAGYQNVIVGSTSTPRDSLGPEQLKQKLMNSGIIIIDKYLEKISEIYQLSDLYIFPVIDECSSIGLPLSVLEARACGIPVLTTDFGSIKKYLGDDFGNILYSTPNNFLESIKNIKGRDADRLKTSVKEINQKFNRILFSEINKM